MNKTIKIQRIVIAAMVMGALGAATINAGNSSNIGKCAASDTIVADTSAVDTSKKAQLPADFLLSMTDTVAEPDTVAKPEPAQPAPAPEFLVAMRDTVAEPDTVAQPEPAQPEPASPAPASCIG